MAMSGDLYVGNISHDTTEDQIREHFTSAGNVQAVNMMTDRKGRFRCFGFITIDNPEEAVELLNGKELNGRQLKVSRAIPETPFRSGGQRFHRGRRR